MLTNMFTTHNNNSQRRAQTKVILKVLLVDSFLAPLAWYSLELIALAFLAALISLDLERLVRWRLTEAAQVAAELARDGYPRVKRVVRHAELVTRGAYDG